MVESAPLMLYENMVSSVYDGSCSVCGLIKFSVCVGDNACVCVFVDAGGGNTPELCRLHVLHVLTPS